MERLINTCYDDKSSRICGGSDGFARLVGILLGNGDDRGLADILLSLYETLSAYPEGASALLREAEQLRAYAEEDFFACPHGKRIEAHLAGMLAHFKNAYKACLAVIDSEPALAKAYSPAFTEDLKGILTAEQALAKGYAAGRDAIRSVTFSRLGSYRGEKSSMLERIKETRNTYKKQIAAVIDGYLSTSAAQLKADILNTAGVCAALGDLLCTFEEKLEAEKKRRNVCDFSDLSRYTLRLLVDAHGEDTPFAKAQKQLYDAVYIDEYQDVNAVQDRIFAAISTETNRFMVGDIKQSIYAFRGAEPSIFARLRHAFPPIDSSEASKNATVFMSENFRCGKEIVDFTNMVFDTLMPLLSPDMHYAAEDALVFRKSATPEEVRPVEIVLTEKPPKDAPDADRNTEAEFVAREILRLTREECKMNGEPITFDDVAILMRSPKGKADVFSAILRAHGIPVYTETSESLLAQSEIEILLCLLEAIDNPRRDIALAGALLSPLCGIHCDTLAALRGGVRDERLVTTLRRYEGEESEKINAFLTKLTELRRMARYMHAGELCDAVYTELALPARLCGEDVLRRANLEKFRQLAYTAASNGNGSLSAFLRYLRAAEKNAKAQLTAAKPGGETHGAVRIMSVHQSKGLEYPVVFFADTAKAYNLRDADASPLYTHAAGFGMRLRDDSGYCVYDTLLRKSVALAKRRAEKEEELRLLYVALTRARERLYMTAMTAAPQKFCEDMAFAADFLSEYAALSEKDHLSLSLLTLPAEEVPFVKVRTVPYGIPEALPTATAEVQTVESTEETERLVATLEERFAYRYPNEARTRIPAKLSISRLYPDILDDVILEEVISEERLPQAVKAPRFITGEDVDAAKRGTATHLFMQFFDFAYARASGAEAELKRLTDARFLTAEDAALVNLDEVKSFLASPLFSDMCAAKRIYREQRFNLTLPAADFATDAGLKEAVAGETVLVQGVIDCFFHTEDGEIVLVDYKTDRLPSDRAAAEKKLRAAHSRQLSYYKRAIEEICGKAPRNTLIYSLCLGDAISV